VNAVVLDMKLVTLFVLTALALAAQTPCTQGTFAGTWNGWGADTFNTRHQPITSITAANVSKLAVKWAFGMPGARSAFGPPSVMDG